MRRKGRRRAVATSVGRHGARAPLRRRRRSGGRARRGPEPRGAWPDRRSGRRAGAPGDRGRPGQGCSLHREERPGAAASGVGSEPGRRPTSSTRLSPATAAWRGVEDRDVLAMRATSVFGGDALLGSGDDVLGVLDHVTRGFGLFDGGVGADEAVFSGLGFAGLSARPVAGGFLLDLTGGQAGLGAAGGLRDGPARRRDAELHRSGRLRGPRRAGAAPRGAAPPRRRAGRARPPAKAPGLTRRPHGGPPGGAAMGPVREAPAGAIDPRGRRPRVSRGAAPPAWPRRWSDGHGLTGPGGASAPDGRGGPRSALGARDPGRWRWRSGPDPMPPAPDVGPSVRGCGPRPSAAPSGAAW